MERNDKRSYVRRLESKLLRGAMVPALALSVGLSSILYQGCSEPKEQKTVQVEETADKIYENSIYTGLEKFLDEKPVMKKDIWKNGEGFNLINSSLKYPNSSQEESSEKFKRWGASGKGWQITHTNYGYFSIFYIDTFSDEKSSQGLCYFPENYRFGPACPGSGLSERIILFGNTDDLIKYVKN